MNAWHTLNQFIGEHLTVASGKLRCDACKKNESEKKSSVMKHIASPKRIKSKTVITNSNKKDQIIVDLGPVVRKEVSANPGLTFNPGFIFFQ